LTQLKWEGLKSLTSAIPGLTLNLNMNLQGSDKQLEPGSENITPDNKQIVKVKPSLWKSKQFRYILLIVIAALVVILVTVFVQKPTNRDQYIQSSGYLGVFLMAVLGSASPVWPLSGSLAAFIAGGMHLNPIIVGLAAGFGEPIGELTFYTVGYGSQVMIEKWKRYNQIMNWMRRHGAPTIFILSAIPNFLIKLATTAAGALHYPVWKFFISCWAGKTIKSMGFAFLGYYLFEAIKNLIFRIF
jgi:membrane protein DedA with SNARE-associated domain